MAEINRRILVVDDEREIVQAYLDFLAPAPSSSPKRSSRSATAPAAAGPEYELLAAYSGEEAVAVFKRELDSGRRIAAGFFDVKLEGGMDGLQTMQALWKMDPRLHCTVVTAYQDRSVNDMDQLFGTRFNDQWDYLNKPFTQAEIVQKARQMIAAWNRRRDLERAQAQLIHSERLAAIGQVARAIGHEFGNILQSIVGKADLGRQDADPAKNKERFELILKAADRATLIVRNLQSFSKGQSTRTKASLSQIVKDTLLLINHELKKRSVEVSESFASTGTFHGCAAEIEQVFLNLIMNAIHAMPNGGKLELGCREEGDSVLAWVKDTGTGIPPEVLPRIFEYAFTTKGEKGSGLGLSISKEIVENHGGMIAVRSKVGEGTMFEIRVPRLK